MNLVKASIGLSKTVKNMGRSREIVTVFARNGFAEFMASGVSNAIPNFILPESSIKLKEEFKGKGERAIQDIIGYRLRICFEELGPAFIKIGQLLSSREDMFAPGFIRQMKMLQDQVKGIEFSKTQEILANAWGKPIDGVFDSFTEEPIGKASIGVVYEGTLKSGESVVVKVRRPNIRRIIKTDMEIFLFLILQIEKVSEEFKFLGLSRIIYDFSRTLESELNFFTEAQSCERLKKNIANYDKDNIFYLPKIYNDYTTEDVLVMEKLDGIPFSSPNILDHSEEIGPKLNRGIHLFIQTFLQDGFFHADLHGGNFFYLKNGQIGIIDFGLMGVLSKKGRINFLAIIYAIITYNFESLVYEFLEVADYDEIPDTDELIADVRDALYPQLGLSVEQTNVTVLFSEITRTLAKHKIYIPREWFVVFRALMTLDGVGKSLKLDVNLFEILQADIRPLLQSSFSKDDVIEELSWLSKDYLSLMRIMPRQLKWFWREFSKNRYSFKIQNSGYEKQFAAITSAIHYLSNTLLVLALIALGISFMFAENKIQFSKEYLPSWLAFGAAFLFWFGSYIKVSKK